MSDPAAYRGGFRVVGGPTGERIAVDAALAFSAYAQCDPAAQCDREAYLSAFTFNTDDAEFARRIGPGDRANVRGFNGPCFSPFVWFDIDRDDFPTALLDARRLVGFILNEFRDLDDAVMMVFFSGRKGFHVAVPVGATGAVPSRDFNRHARGFAESLAGKAGMPIDQSIYDRVRLLRAPNSRHPKSGRYKRHLSHDELMHLSADRILQLASESAPFDVPPSPAPIPAVVAAWAAAAPPPSHRDTPGADASTRPPGRLQRATLDFIRGEPPAEGQRNVRLYAAASNLMGHGTPIAVVRDLLTGPARDSGLSPSEVEQAITSAARGIAARQRGGAA